MNLTKTIYLLLMLSLCYNVIGQKFINPIKTEQAVTIDGILDEDDWKNSEVSNGFITIRPEPGLNAAHDTDVKIMYDDHALYVSAFMHDSSRDSIMTQLTERDDLGNTDFILIYIDTYQGGNDATQFVLASTGVQMDAKVTTGHDEDWAWDAIWKGAVQLTDKGWYAEMEIPYSAIRFSKKNIQEWNLNFIRRRVATGEQSTWNPVDLKKDNPTLTQMGKLVNLQNIKPPLRLSFSPYVSLYGIHSKDASRVPITSTASSYNGGMDVKWGINEAFTLDMTLIPDFGQVQSDDQVLNLSPFEVRFDENRPFFTEGGEFFQKAGIFYSRRIGGRPIDFYNAYDNLDENESVVNNPASAQLYNATKISGRNAKGLGLGFFNAIAASTEATIENELTAEKRQVKTSPLTNYNVFILDQNLKNNSSVSLTNTNVWRQGSEFYDANVTALTFNIKDKKQKFGLSTNTSFSHQSFVGQDNISGHALEINLERLDGQFVYGLSYEQISDEYDSNDLGFLNNNNDRQFRANLQYRRFDGFWKLNQFQSWLNVSHNRLYKSNAYANTHINAGFWGQTTGLWNVNMWFNYRPDSYDHFEPRRDGWFHKNPDMMNAGFWFGSDSRKPFRLEVFGFAYNMNEEGRYGIEYGVEPRIRISDQLTLSADSRVEKEFRGKGWVDYDSVDDVIYSTRDRTTVSNRLGLNYSLNPNMSINVRVRHYWSKVAHLDFVELMSDGSFDTSDYNSDKNLSFNSFTTDAVFRWRFAAGSDLFVVWKNNITGVHQEGEVNYETLDYFTGLEHLNQFPQNNSLSLRCVYYLDYNGMVSRFKS